MAPVAAVLFTDDPGGDSGIKSSNGPGGGSAVELTDAPWRGYELTNLLSGGFETVVGLYAGSAVELPWLANPELLPTNANTFCRILAGMLRWALSDNLSLT